MVEILLLLTLTEKISPLELMLVWLFNRVSNHPLPDLCIERIAKYLTGWQAHSALNVQKENIYHQDCHQIPNWSYEIVLPSKSFWFWVVHIRNIPRLNLRLGTWSVEYFKAQKSSLGANPYLLQTNCAYIHTTYHYKYQDNRPQQQWRLLRRLKDKRILQVINYPDIKII